MMKKSDSFTNLEDAFNELSPPSSEPVPNAYAAPIQDHSPVGTTNPITETNLLIQKLGSMPLLTMPIEKLHRQLTEKSFLINEPEKRNAISLFSYGLEETLQTEENRVTYLNAWQDFTNGDSNNLTIFLQENAKARRYIRDNLHTLEAANEGWKERNGPSDIIQPHSLSSISVVASWLTEAIESFDSKATGYKFLLSLAPSTAATPAALAEEEGAISPYQQLKDAMGNLSPKVNSFLYINAINALPDNEHPLEEFLQQTPQLVTMLLQSFRLFADAMEFYKEHSPQSHPTPYAAKAYDIGRVKETDVERRLEERNQHLTGYGL